MDIRYILADPTGNLTALVETSVPPQLRAQVAGELMAANRATEQLGFIAAPSGKGDIALHMSGGEFCGNACLSAGAYYLRQKGKLLGKVSVEISGANTPVAVNLEALEENSYRGFVDMPLPLSIEELESPAGNLPLLRFPGICHAIVTGSLSTQEAEAMIAPLCESVGAAAFGLMLLDEAEHRLTPLVYVPGTGSLFWERSCASGTSAVGAWLAQREGRSVSLTLAQPGGSLSISAVFESGHIRSLSMGGTVQLGTKLQFTI